MIKSIVAGNWKMNKTPKNGKLFISEVLANIDEIINVDDFSPEEVDQIR